MQSPEMWDPMVLVARLSIFLWDIVRPVVFLPAVLVRRGNEIWLVGLVSVLAGVPIAAAAFAIVVWLGPAALRAGGWPSTAEWSVLVVFGVSVFWILQGAMMLIDQDPRNNPPL